MVTEDHQEEGGCQQAQRGSDFNPLAIFTHILHRDVARHGEERAEK
jgi:hypothetical protein